MTKRRTNGFTLIEMLTVMVIIVIILSIGIPAFTNLMKSGGLSGGSREVANALGLARQYAITHRTTTRVVFPYNGTMFTPAYTVTMFTSATNLCPWYQSYAVLSISSGATNYISGLTTNYVPFSTTNYISKWEHLPLGTVFMDNNATVAPPAPPCLNNLQTTNFPFPYANSSPLATLAYIEFQPTGAASQAGTLTVTEGFLNSGTTTPAVVPTSKTSANTLANQSVISVDNIIGRVQVTRP